MNLKMKRRDLLASAAAATFLAACGGGGEAGADAAVSAGNSAGAADALLKAGALSRDATALRIADYILSLQLPAGAILDSKGDTMVNEDSNMEYALIGLAAAYNRTRDVKYLEGLRKGVEWLGANMTMGDPFWAGSFPLYFTAPGLAGNYATRGVDATSSLFVYCTYLHQRLSGSTTLRDKYEPQIRAALSFLDAHNTSKDGFSLSSWVNGTLWAYEYAADQVDVYLGWEAARIMFPGDPHYSERAAFYRNNIQKTFFMAGKGRYSIGRDEGSALESTFDGFDGIFPNGYLPWALGPSDLNSKSLSWLESRMQADGSMLIGKQTRAYALTAAIYLCGCVGTGRSPQQPPIDWLCNAMFDARTGGVNDSTTDNTKYSNVSGFSVVGLLGFTAFA